MTGSQRNADADAGSKGDPTRHAGMAVSINDSLIVLRYVDDLWIGRFDQYQLLPVVVLEDDTLLWPALQCTGLISVLTQNLNCIHDGCLIRLKGSADRRVVIDVLRHHVDDLRKVHQGEERWIEALRLSRIHERLSAQPRILPEPAIDVKNLLRVGGGRRDLR
jgi:hypothetical protein